MKEFIVTDILLIITIITNFVITRSFIVIRKMEKEKFAILKTMNELKDEFIEEINEVRVGKISSFTAPLLKYINDLQAILNKRTNESNDEKIIHDLQDGLENLNKRLSDKKTVIDFFNSNINVPDEE